MRASPDADGVALRIKPKVTDVNIVTARYEVESGGVTESGVMIAGVPEERIGAKCGIPEALRIRVKG
jgi:hypothetical protein